MSPTRNAARRASVRNGTWLCLTLAAVAALAPCPAAACPADPIFWANEAYPYYVAVAPSGRVYATDPNSNTVSIHAANGSLLNTWGSLGTAHGQLDSPLGIAVDATGKVYVADLGNSRIEIFDADGGYLSTISHFGVGPGLFLAPGDLAIGPANDLFVVEQIPGSVKVVRYSLTGTYMNEWPVTISNTLYDISVDTDGSVYGMALGSMSDVSVFSSAGAPLHTWSPALPSETADFARLEAWHGVVCVSLINGDGQFLRTFDGLGNVQCPGIAAPGLDGIAVGSTGNTYVGDGGGGQLFVTTDFMIPTRGRTWGQLKAMYR